MNGTRIWHHWKLFDKRILIDMPSEYELKSKIGRQYVYIGTDKKGMVITELPNIKDDKAFLWNIYMSVKKAFETVSEPAFFKRRWMGIEQRRMQITANNKNVMYVFLGEDEHQYLIEFTYEGNDEIGWRKESEYILNNIRTEEGKISNGD